MDLATENAESAEDAKGFFTTKARRARRVQLHFCHRWMGMNTDDSVAVPPVQHTINPFQSPVVIRFIWPNDRHIERDLRNCHSGFSSEKALIKGYRVDDFANVRYENLDYVFTFSRNYVEQA